MPDKISWSEIVEKYPDRWVALTDCEKKGSRVLAAVPIRVCEEKDMYDTELELNEKGISFIWRRTTELEGAHILCRI